ncbi:MAG: imidazole glycerol phosphate synthase subunit HisH [Opitutaceae bacterium]
MPGATIAVIDNGICNLRSVTKALEAVGSQPLVVTGPKELAAAEAAGLVLPGVGALRDCVGALRVSGLDRSVKEWIAADRPFLGVCLGMQALFERSEEGGVRGLGIFEGEVVRFRRPAGFKIPHMGWNTLEFLTADSPIADGLARTGESVYFVHSYHCRPADPALIIAECDYGGRFPAIVARGKVFATQFHPEKSQATGLRIYANFVRGVAAPEATEDEGRKK